MKFIVTGCTGFIGGEVLAQCLRNPAITSVIALSRRELPSAVNSPKLQVVIMPDFHTYPEPILQKLVGADACIWCMGTTAGDPVLELDYPLAFVNAMGETRRAPEKTFRYLHLSGATTERDQEAPLWFKGGMRKVKGLAEQNLLDFAQREEHKGLWETIIIKSGFVVSNTIRTPRDLMGKMMGTKLSIQKDELAALMIDVAIDGSKDTTLHDCQDMVTRGRAALQGK